MALYHTFPLIARIFFSNSPSAVYSFPPRNGSSLSFPPIPHYCEKDVIKITFNFVHRMLKE